jgi:prolyl 4-hydroxylase
MTVMVRKKACFLSEYLVSTPVNKSYLVRIKFCITIDRAVNVTMEPGDMVLYESGSLTHGRPYPLRGNFYANTFIHFQPTGEHLNDGSWEYMDDFHPPYILPESPEMSNWERRNPAGWKKQSPSAAAPGIHEGHAAAAHGDIDSLMELAAEDKRALHLKDKNGWQPIHEAVRGGHLETVKYLVQQNADVNSVTNFGKGGVSPYYISVQNHGHEHPVTEFLSSLGAIMVGPEL